MKNQLLLNTSTISLKYLKLLCDFNYLNIKLESNNKNKAFIIR